MTLLSELPIGQQGKVKTVDCTDLIGMRLLEMGLTPGVNVAVVGAAPLGDPIELELRGYRLSVRRSEAQRVVVDSTLS